MADDNLVLTIVIPALNEEAAIGNTIERTLAARMPIVEETPVSRVEVVVVSDGSTDRTVEIAMCYPEVALIIFRDDQGRPQNRGYGAAIKAGWGHGTGELLAFLDADGTCDPRGLVPLISELIDKNLDVVLGSRMGHGSQMPDVVRRLGNTLYAGLLGLLARQQVRDVASGFRVVRRRALTRLFPLPNRLHFTPAMSARALLDEHVTIGEVPIDYAERIGRSKLNVFADGFRFLAVILSTALYVRPSRITFPISVLLLMLSTGLLAHPVIYYLTRQHLEEWMIYRFLTASLLGTLLVSLPCATIIGEQIIAVSLGRYPAEAQRSRTWWHWLDGWRLVCCILLLLAMGIALVGPGVVEYISTTRVTLHWSRVMIASFVLFLIIQIIISVVLTKAIMTLSEQQTSWLDELVTSARRQVQSEQVDGDTIRQVEDTSLD